MNSIKFEDKDYLNNILSPLKEMSKNYAIALTEASNEILYKELKKSFDSVIKLQRETFELMYRNGFYKLEKVEKEKLNNKYSTLYDEYKKLEID